MYASAPVADGIYHSRALPGLWLRVEPLWHDPVPDVDLTVSEIAPEAYARALASHLSGPSVQALLDELRALGKLPDDGN